MKRIMWLSLFCGMLFAIGFCFVVSVFSECHVLSDSYYSVSESYETEESLRNADVSTYMGVVSEESEESGLQMLAKDLRVVGYFLCYVLVLFLIFIVVYCYGG